MMGIYHISFERRRWSESMFSGGGESMMTMTMISDDCIE